MKKKMMLFLAVIMCLTWLNPMMSAQVSAASNEVELYQVDGQTFSDWAMADLLIGDTYGIYPLEWYLKDMTAPITRVQLRKLLGEVRGKLLDTEKYSEKVDRLYRYNKTATVSEVLDYFYQTMTEFTFAKDLGLKDKTAVQFMKEKGIYTGKNGEQKLTDLCSVEQACVIGTRVVTYVYDQLDAASKGFFWKTEANGNTVYLLGSIHIASNDIYPLNDEILKAYASADALAVEVNLLDSTGAATLWQYGSYTDGTTLKDHLSEETYKKAVEIAALIGYTEADIAPCKPWYLYTMFSALSFTSSADAKDAAQAANLGVDMNFLTNSMVYGKPVMEVEGYAYQAKVLDSFSDKLEEYLLNSTIDSIQNALKGTAENSNVAALDTMLQLWKEGNTEDYKTYTSMEYEYPELYTEENAAEKALMNEFQQKLFTNRDTGMAEYIDTLLKAEGGYTYFVVVGSSHYVSNHSVIDMLTEKGYTLTQIK